MSDKLMTWLKAALAIKDGKQSTCPKCGGHNVKYGYVKLTGYVGYGAVWCEDCRQAQWLSRVLLEQINESDIVDKLPDDLILL